MTAQLGLGRGPRVRGRYLHHRPVIAKSVEFLDTEILPGERDVGPATPFAGGEEENCQAESREVENSWAAHSVGPRLNRISP